MTKQEAKKCFNLLYQSILSNGFTDISAFIFTEEDSEFILKKLYDEVQQDENEIKNLKKLIKAIKTYFKKSSSLVSEINDTIDSLPIKNKSNIILLLTNSEELDISKINGEQEYELITLINILESQIGNDRDINNDNDFKI